MKTVNLDNVAVLEVSAIKDLLEDGGHLDVTTTGKTAENQSVRLSKGLIFQMFTSWSKKCKIVLDHSGITDVQLDTVLALGFKALLKDKNIISRLQQLRRVAVRDANGQVVKDNKGNEKFTQVAGSDTTEFKIVLDDNSFLSPELVQAKPTTGQSLAGIQATPSSEMSASELAELIALAQRATEEQEERAAKLKKDLTSRKVK